jgi:hypothetical protein
MLPGAEKKLACIGMMKTGVDRQASYGDLPLPSIDEVLSSIGFSVAVNPHGLVVNRRISAVR